MESQSYQPYQQSPKDPNTAFLIEFVGGFFGLLGLGYLYDGRTNDGVVRLIVWLLVLFGVWLVVGLLSAVIIGICLIPVAFALQVGIPLWSANELKKQMIAGQRPM
jgi:TM2 domain-containing membrane protein YozV